jgi:hypothetical protein
MNKAEAWGPMWMIASAGESLKGKAIEIFCEIEDLSGKRIKL